ncbi:MAG: ATP-binding protein [Acidimicrobiia bacterium]
MAPLLVLVSGSPGSGKTTLARRLAADLVIPLLGKDTIKEALGDSLVVDSVERSQQLGRASVEVLYALVKGQLDLGVSVVVDHAFHQAFADAVVPLVDGSTAVLVHCTAPDELITERVLDRAARGERHPVHFDVEVTPFNVARYAPMELDIPTLVVDTTDGYRPDYPTIVGFIEGAR